MIGASIYAPAVPESLRLLATQLRIPGANVAPYGTPRTDFGFYAREENSMTYAPLSGDFGFLCDVELFRMTRPDLIDTLRVLSASGLLLAIPDEDSENPDDCLLFEAGTVKHVPIYKDDVLDEVKIMRSTRKENKA